MTRTHVHFAWRGQSPARFLRTGAPKRLSGGALWGCGLGASARPLADEVRSDGLSDILYMPQYREPLLARKVRAVCDVLRDDPNHANGKHRWTDRLYFRDTDGRLRPLRELWPAGDPIPVRASRRAVQSLERWPLRHAVRLALSRGADRAA